MDERITNLQKYREAVDMARHVEQAAFHPSFRAIADGSDVILFGTEWLAVPVDMTVEAYLLPGMANSLEEVYGMAFCDAYPKALYEPRGGLAVAEDAYEVAEQAAQRMLVEHVKSQGLKPFASFWLDKNSARNDVKVHDWDDMHRASSVRDAWMCRGVNDDRYYRVKHAWSARVTSQPMPVDITIHIRGASWDTDVRGYLSPEPHEIAIVSNDLLSACSAVSAGARPLHTVVYRNEAGQLVFHSEEFSNQDETVLQERSQDGELVVDLPFSWRVFEVRSVAPTDLAHEHDATRREKKAR